MKLVFTAGTAAALALIAHGAQAQIQSTNIIDPLNPTFTQALGINDNGLVVGYGNQTIFNGFQVTQPFGSGNFVRENFPNAAGGTQVVGVDGAGTSVGFYVLNAPPTTPPGNTNGFINQNGSFTTVDQPGTVFNQLLGINQSGTTAAGYSSATDPAGATGQQAYTYSIGTKSFTNINALLPTNLNSQATGVNNSGLAVGFYQYNTAGDFSAFTDRNGTITSFQFPGSASTQALGVNNLGSIVGDYVDANGVMHGFLDVDGLFTTLDPSGSTATTANGINDLNQIVGFYVNGAGDTIGFLTQVPEPASLFLFGAGLAGLMASRRARRQS